MSPVRIHRPGLADRLKLLLRTRARRVYNFYSGLYLDRRYFAPARDLLQAHYQGLAVPPLERVKIETNTACNRQCMFCPVQARPKELKNKEMPLGTFEKIVGDLAAMGFSGHVCMSLNNEPLIDTRLESLISLVREGLPEVSGISMVTNGDLLTAERIEGSFDAGLTGMVVDNYNDDFLLNQSIELAIRGIKDHPRYSIDVWMRAETDVLNSEGGHLDVNRGPDKPRKQFCYYPFYEINFGFDGSALVCCHDALYEGIVGNVNETGVEAIWGGERLQRYRRRLLDGDRSLTPCRACDYEGASVARAHKITRAG